MSKVTRNNNTVTMDNLLSRFHLQQYLPLFQRHNIDLKVFLILIIYIQKISELLIAEAVKDPMILITNDNEINNLIINTDDDSSEDCYESEDQSEDQSEDDDEVTIVPLEEEVVVPKDDDDVVNNDIDNDIDNVEVEQHESGRLIETIAEENSDSEKNTEVVISQSPDFDEIPKDSPPPYFSPSQTSQTITTTSTKSSSKRVSRVKKSVNFWKFRKQSDEKKLINKLARDHKLPSYYEATRSPSCEEGKEVLPPYSCSVSKAGYLMKKNEMSTEDHRANDRSWRKIYLYLWGTFVRIYKSEPNDINRTSPISQFSMNGAKVSLALDYTKKRNVLRIQLLNGRSYLFQALERCEFISWIEKLQSSANISSTIDEREMPMFITLPTRRRRGSQQQQQQLQQQLQQHQQQRMTLTTITTRARSRFGNRRSNNNINNSFNNNIHNSSGGGGSNSGSRMLMPVTTSGLTYQHFNELARELQVVQVVDVLPQQQLLW